MSDTSIIDNPFDEVPPSKAEQLLIAKQGKQAMLLAARSAKSVELGQNSNPSVELGGRTGRTVELDSPTNAGAWTTGLDMNAETSQGKVVNTLASFVSGASRVAGQVASLPLNAGAALIEASLPEEVIQARNRAAKGEATAQDTALLQLKRSATGQQGGAGNITNQTAIARADAARSMAGKVTNAFNFEGIVDQSRREEFSADLGSGFQGNWDKAKEGFTNTKDGKIVDGATNMVSGLAGLLVNAGDAVGSNPGAVSEYIVENLPQLGLGLLGAAGKGAMAASNVGYAADTYRQGIENFQAKNGGALPSAEERQKMAVYAASLALAEQVGDVATLGLGKAAKVLGSGAESTAKTGGREALKNILKASVGGGATEAVTEGYQTFAEGKVTGKNASAQDIYTGAVIGGVSGGALAGGMRTVAEVAKATPEYAAERQTAASKAEQFDKAVEAGDHTVFLDEKSKSYDPVAAVRVLYATSQKADATPEAKQKNLETASEVVTNLEEKQEKLQASLYTITPAGLKKTQDTLAGYEARLKATDPADVDMVGALEDGIEMAKAEIAEFATAIPAKKKDAAKLESQLSQLTRQLDDSRGVRDEMLSVQNSSIKDSDVLADVELADKGDAPAVSRIINLSMSAPGKLSTEAAAKLSSNTANSLTAEQRTYLRAFSEARQTENRLSNMKKVSQEILTGTPPAEVAKGKTKNLGIMDFRTEIGAAVVTNNEARAKKYVDLLGVFRADHSDKATVAAQAYEATLADGQLRQVLKAPTGWMATTSLVSEKERVANGGLDIHPIKSKNLVPNMKVEAQALDNAYTELSTATALRFAKGAVQSVPSQAAPTTKAPQNNLPQKTVEQQSRPSLRAGEGTASQSEKKEEEVKKVEKTNAVKATSSPSPASTAAVPIAVAGAPAQDSAVSSAPAVEEKVVTPPSPVEAASQDTAQQDVTSEASATPAAEVAQAGLRVFNQKQDIPKDAKLGDYFLKVNPIAQFLKQELNSERYKTARPLVAQPSFLASWKADPRLPLQFLEEGDAVLENDSMKAALNSLEEHLEKWTPLFDNNLSEFGGTAAFKAEDLMQFLMEKTEDGKLQLEENVKTAMAYSAYSWMLGQLNSPAWKTQDDIAQMHGMGKETYVSEQGFQELRSMVGFEDRVIHELGEGAVQALGLQPEANAPMDLLPRLKMALGTHILMMLASPQVGMVKRAAIENARVQSFFKIDGDADADNNTATGEAPNNVFAEGFNAYVRLNREGTDTRVMTGAQQRIRDANVQSQGVVDRLFGADKAARIAGMKPVKFTQKFAKHTQQAISDNQRQAIQETMDTPHTAIPEMVALFESMGRENVLAVAGHQDLADEAIHDINRESIEAQNMNLEGQFDKAWEMIFDPNNPDGTEQEFYVEQAVGKNSRAFFANQSLNQQTSKIHRVLFSRPQWKATIKLSDTDMVNEFKIAIAMSLGVSTDKQNNTKSLEKFEAKLRDEPEIMQAVDIIRAGVLNADASVWTDANKKLVSDVAANREGMMSLQALMAFAKFHEAQIDHDLAMKAGEKGDTEFEVTLLVGVDGKVNGTMLSHLALGAADNIEDFYVLLNRGGFYSTDDGQANHYSEWYGRGGNQDLYENLGARIIDRVKTLVTPEKALWAMRKAGDKSAKDRFTEGQLKAIERVTKQLLKDDMATKEMRGLTKGAMNPFAFGSSLNKAVASMEIEFITSVYGNIQTLAKDQNGNKASDEQVSEYIAHLNTLLNLGDYKLDMPIPNMPIEGLLKYKLKPEQEITLRKAFKQVIGKSVKAEMEEYFATFITRRRQLNSTIQAAYQAYEAAYAAVRMSAMERLMESGEVASRISKAKDGTETRVPLHDLTVKQENEIRKSISSLLPVMHSHYSLEQNDLGSGLYMAKTKVNISESPLYQSKVYTARKINRMAVDKDGKRVVKGFPHLTSKAQTRIEQSPGVAGAAYSIHSSDSSIMHQMLRRVKGSLNVHDEGSNGVRQTRELAQGLNRATAETFLAYSPPREAAFMLERVITNMAKQIRSGAVTPAAVKVMVESWAEMYNKGAPEEEQVSNEEAVKLTLQDALQNAYMADRMRLTALTTLKSVDQYVWEGGQFVVDNAFRKSAEKKLAQVEKQGTAAQAATTADLAFLLEQYAEVKDQEIVVPAWVDIKRGEAQPNDDFAPRAKSSSAVAELGTPAIMSNPALVKAFTDKPVMTMAEAATVLRKELRDDFSQKLLSQLVRSAGDVELRYVTAKTQPEELLDLPKTGARGYYVSKGDARAIYVLSPEFKQSGLDPEVMLHEMVHAALVNVTRNPSKEAAPLVAELNALMVQVKGQISGFDIAFANLDEFIAYGMTNAGFQAALLNTAVKPSQNVGNRLVQAMQSFIDTITALVFGRKNASMANGMGVMLTNVSGLLEEAAMVQPSSADVNLSITSPTTTTAAIYDALGQAATSTVTPGFDLHLRNVMGSIVTKLHGPFGVFKDMIATTQATDPTDIWIEAKLTGVAPFASQVLGQAFAVTEQEAFVLEQVEATMRTVLTDNEGQTTVAHRELVKLYDEVAGKLTKQSFIDAGLDPDLFDFVFSVAAGADNKSDYLSRFAALGMANEQFAGMLGFATASAPTNRADMSIMDRLHAIFDKLLSFLNGRFTKTYAGQDADEKLESLMNSLVNIELKKRHRLGVQRSRSMEDLEEVLRGGMDKVRGTVVKAANSKFIQNNRIQTIGAAGTVVAMIAGDRVEQVLEGINELRDRNFHERQGVMAGIVNELRGANASNLPFHSLLRSSKNNERERKELIDNTARTVIESFANRGADLSKEQKDAISSVFLRTDMSALLAHYTLDELGNLMTDPAALNKAIVSFETQLAASPFRVFMMNAGEALGYYKATGRVRSAHLLMNAGNIARLYGTKHVRRVTEQQAQAMEKIIDPLVSLYALRHTNSAQMAQALSVFTAEAARTDKGNGIEMVLKLHKALQEQSKARLFQGSEALQMKGYTTEIYNPYMDVVVANAEEGANLELQGYTKGAEVAIEAGVDPDTEKKHIYSLRDGGLQPHLTGVMSYTGMKAKGTRKHNGNVSLASKTGIQNAGMMGQIASAKTQHIDTMFTQRINPAKVSKNHMAPVLNAQGDVANYRYLMEESTKNVLLERDNRFDRVIGAMAGSIYDKETSPVQNRAAVEALKAQYDAEYATKTASYIKVGPTSADPEMREIWRLLPDSTKQAVREVWGRDEMMVRIDLLDINFGYRKLSLANTFQKDEDERTMKEQMFVDFWASFLGPKAELRIRQAEDIWQTVVREAKDIVVVKSGITLLGNIMSNATELLWFGVSPSDILRHHRVAIKGAMAYRKDSKELFDLETQLSTGYITGDTAEMKKRVVRLQDALARNPVRNLIDAGLMPTIAEDVSVDDEIYSYKSRFTRFLEDKSSKLNPTVVKAARLVYMTHDTDVYRFLNNTTQLSDFVARYTLYQHMTSRAKNPLTNDAAVQLASDAFINYDVPTHRTMQYLNDTGLLWFTKYYLRIQKVILHLYRENPGRALGMLALNGFFDTVPTLLDSAAMTRFGNPFSVGALNYPGSLDQLATVKAAMSPFN